LQVTIPPDVTLHVLVPEAHEMCLVLPLYPADWPAGLSVDALEQRLTQGTGPLAEAQQTVVRGQARLVAQAWHDTRFKQALLQNPNAVVEREFGAPLPAEVTLRVVAEDAHTQYLVLPPALSDLELSDAQLEQVAGGEFVIAVPVTMFVSLTVAAVGTWAWVLEGAKLDW
jgi:hypothetical protein